MNIDPCLEAGSPTENGKIEETFSPEALEIISNWILELMVSIKVVTEASSDPNAIALPNLAAA